MSLSRLLLYWQKLFDQVVVLLITVVADVLAEVSHAGGAADIDSSIPIKRDDEKHVHTYVREHHISYVSLSIRLYKALSIH